MSEITRCAECTDEIILQNGLACNKCENVLCGYCCEFEVTIGVECAGVQSQTQSFLTEQSARTIARRQVRPYVATA